MKRTGLSLTITLGLLATAHSAQPEPGDLERFRQEYAQELYTDTRLMIVARFDVEPRTYSLGHAESNDLVLPSGPPKLGVFELKENTARLVPEPASGPPAVLPIAEAPGRLNPHWIGTLGFAVNRRDGRTRLAVLDKDAEFVRDKRPLRWFAANAKYRITARFVPFDQPTNLEMPYSTGPTRQQPSPGLVSFEIDGQPVTLQPYQSGKQLFFVFRDLTSRDQTYGAGRFLYADEPKDGLVTLDFNKATNPLCAYNAFVSCPIPPPQNRLKVAIPAGEMNYSAH